MRKILLFLVFLVYLSATGKQAYAQWIPVGPDDFNQLSFNTVSHTSSAFIGNTFYVAYWDGANYPYATQGNLTVKKLNASGTGWETVGQSGILQGTAGTVNFAYNGNTPYIVYGTSIFKLNTSTNNWDAVSLNTAGLTGLQLTHSSGIAFHDNTIYSLTTTGNYTLTLKKLNSNGTSWDNVGSDIAASTSSISAYSVVFQGNTPYVAYTITTSSGPLATVKKLNTAGTSWETVGTADFSGSYTYSLSLNFNNGTPYIAYTSAPNRFGGGKPVIQKLNAAGTAWELVGGTSDFSGVQAESVYMEFNGNTPYVVYNTYNGGKATVKRLDAAGANWETVGMANFSNYNAVFPSLTFNNGIPYVTYVDGTYNDTRARVKKFNNTTNEWIAVGGNDISGGSFAYANGAVYAAYADGSGNISVKRMSSDGMTWTVVGNPGFLNSSATYVMLKFNGTTPYVVYADGTNGNKVSLMKLNNAGTAWELVGQAGFTPGSVNQAFSIALAFDGNTPYVAYRDNNNAGKVLVMRLSTAGTAWEIVGNSNASPGGTNHLALTVANGVPYVAFADATNSNKGVIRKLNVAGTGWETVGTVFSSGSAGYMEMATAGNIPYIAYSDFQFSDYATVKKLNGAGTDWEVVGSANFTNSTAQNKVFGINNGTPYLAYADGTNGYKVTVEKLNNAGTDWETLGSAGFSAGISGVNALGFNGSTVYVVYNNSGTYVKKFADAANPEPLITAISPGNAATGGTITITGTNLTGATSVNFGGVPATSFTVNSATSIVATVGSGASGTVAVTTPGGTATYAGFIYNAPPIITAFTPAITGSQTQVVITGTGFTGATAVNFGGTAAQSFTVNSATTITAVVGAGASGNVTVTTSYGTVSKAGFTFVSKPVITAGSSTTFASGGSVVLTASAGTGYTYQWSKNGSAITGATSASYTATESGNYTAAITAGTYTISTDPITVNVIFALPANNFKVSSTSVTCKGQNNGSISIAATQLSNYTVTLTGAANKTANFNTASLLSDLAPGAYNVCITVAGQPNYKQCFDVNITEPKDLAVYTSVNKTVNTLSLSLNGGSVYDIQLNGTSYRTTNSSITIPLEQGSNKLIVTTDKACQGVIEQIINTTGNLMPYPNPFTDILYVNLGETNVGSATIKIYNLADGKLVLNQRYTNRSGVVQLDVPALSNGIYSFNLSLDNKESTFKIFKK